VACLLLLGAYGAASALVQPGGTLGTDTGAKVATLDHMARAGTWTPEVPYWAQAEDPAGRVHPIYDTGLVDGHWVHVTTLPMLIAARPLYEAGGYRLTLVLPMLGAVGAALAARSLARRLRDEAAGWWAFWIVGLASPVAVYALDLWEHSIGVACAVGAVALLAGIVEGEPIAARAVGAGALLGLGATMRTEALVYAAVAVAACAAALLLDRRRGGAVAVVAAAVGGFSVPWLANAALERSVGGLSRGGRVSGAAGGALQDLGDRAREAVEGLFAARSSGTAESLLVGALLVGLVALAVVQVRRGRIEQGRIALAGAAAVCLLRLAGGLGFVPGMLVAAPVAAVALVAVPIGRAGRFGLAVAVGALPLVWATQFLGGALPQWGSRYVLPSCTILVALGAAALPSLDRVVRVGVVALAALVTASGVAWTAQRTHDVDRWFEVAAQRPEDVLIARNGFLVREGGAAYAQRRWLTAVSDEDLRVAVEVVEDAGLRTFGVLDDDPHAPRGVGGAALEGTDRVPFLGTALYLHSYRLPEA
jgi:hypothetical protein